jgi:asparagine synthase (glutamine-hydrolysing)
MCRIAGIIKQGIEAQELRSLVKQMCTLQRHGGPDDEGLYSEEESGMVLGNRRLALLDLSAAGHMPMEYADRYVITYNGELYNFLTLKKELQNLGHRFSNHTDTEVILAAFAQWQVQSFARLKGMFAFALWDRKEKELYLVRDPAGIKPLYYSCYNGSLVFASEIRAFRPVEWLGEENKNWPVYLMAYGHLPEPVTTLAHVIPLRKGCFFKYSTGKKAGSLQSFSHYSYSSQAVDTQSAERNIKAVLCASVKRHLLADAPVGVFLSGGLDSGIIAALAAHDNANALRTLSIYFDDPRFSEKKYQDILLQQLKCNNEQYLLSATDFHESFPAILSAMDLPSSDGINTWFISKYARAQGLKAVLSGVGGDELFGGYPSFLRMRMANLLQQMPGAAIGLGRYSHSKKMSRVTYLRLPGIKGIYLFLRGHFSPHEIAVQLDMEEKEVWRILSAEPCLMDVDRMDEKNKASWMEFNLYMQNQLLRDSDVMSMIHGVEIRVPFLDDELIKLALQMPGGIKYPAPLPKQILINSFKDMLPRAVWDRPKMGFSFPFANWMKGSGYIQDLMMEGNAVTRNSYQQFMEGKMYWYQLMSLVNLRSREGVGKVLPG